ncbi:hypothetical protein AXF42_Ash011328 [Apostasia shenzhenica]|uniref:VOC domain-containing protein n=1 Tax=Apostasia shenzhenica TaxID=1088818 RepID=A0A2I0AE82_9ASPA|nr:hypothetical protein AXF42_Ash011328 [Apostasia shenzhenica]
MTTEAMKFNGATAAATSGPLPLTSINHVSIVCRSVKKSMEFYQSVLGFYLIRRPSSFGVDGAWLFNYRIGIHLLQAEEEETWKMPQKTAIDPKDNHISFQCESMAAVEKQLEEMGVRFVRRTVEEGGIFVDQIFFHDPDGFMIEICNCENFPVIPLLPAVNESPVAGGVLKRVISSILKKQRKKVMAVDGKVGRRM